MAPLGILTIVVSAIRVGGPSWLKAIIGRARENLAVAEVELMSSTSEDVCEVWNGSEIVRSLGSPPVREFIILIPKSRHHFDYPIGLFEFDFQTIKQAVENGHLTISKESGDSEKGTSIWSSKGNAEEIELDNLDPASDSGTLPKIIIIYNESDSAPNISLNVHPQKRAEIRIAAVIGTLLQLGVLIYAGFATYHHALRFPKEESLPVSNYAFPCTATGTILLVTGLLLCADVVEKRTAEKSRKPRAVYEAFPIWVQRQATVGDQVFKSFGIFSNTPRKEVLTSRRNTFSKTPNGVSLVDRIVIVVSYLPLQIVELFKRVLDKKTSSFTESSVQSSKTTLGAFLSISGYVVQFVGLRDMHWSVSIVQLGAVVFMTATRAALRRGLAVPPQARSLVQDFELEWLASIISGTDGDEGVQLHSPENTRDRPEDYVCSSNKQDQGGGQADVINGNDREIEEIEKMEEDTEDSSEQGSHNCRENHSEEEEGRKESKGKSPDNPEKSRSGSQNDIGTYGEAYSNVESDNGEDVDTSDDTGVACGQGSGTVTESENGDYTDTVCSKAQTVMILRSQFAKFTGWRSPVFAEANCLSRAIEVVMNTLFLKSSLEHFRWPLRATYNSSEPQVIDVSNVSMKLIRESWQVNRHHVEAILSLWIFSMKDTHQNGDITSARRGVHLLGADRPQLRRDLRWWVPRDLKKAILVRQSPEGSLVVDKALVVGCGRATTPKVRLERLQMDEDDNNPPYGQSVEKGFLAMESFRSPASLYALDLFSSFMNSVARAIDEPIHGQGEIRPNDGKIPGAWTSFTMHNTLLSKMAVEVQSTGLATLSEVYSAIIPSLSIENRLPLVDNIVELARDHAKPHEERGDMKKATEAYIWLIKTARLFPSDTSFVAKSMVVILDHRTQLIKSTKLSDRLKPIAQESMIRRPKEIPLQQRIENELQLGEPENRSLLIQLMLLYDNQRRLDTVPSQFVKIADQDPDFLQPRRCARRNPSKKDEEGTENCDITGWTQLHRGIAKGDTLLGQTALHLACQAGEIAWATLLARKGADINARTRDRSTPLHYAARQGDLSIVKLIVQFGAEFDAMDSARMTPAIAVLHHAVLSGCCGIVDVFEKGVDAEVRDYEGRTPLQLAVLHGNEDAILILRHKLRADMGVLDDSGNHLMHLAAVGGQMALMTELTEIFMRECRGTNIEALMRLGANLESRNRDGKTALMVACGLGRINIVQQLIDLGADKDTVTDSGSSILDIAALYGHTKVVEFLLQTGVDKHRQDRAGGTALHSAAMNGKVRIVQLLLDAGVEKDKSSFIGMTPLHVAVGNCHVAVAKVLLIAGADKEAKDNNEQTEEVANLRRERILKLLLEAGADRLSAK
ncbi:hypothetical protein FAVG1_00377 [Fusarium avenaceum]|nr:hypothetical protein FAVG1_00377 [Fusarium avenaceum]